MRMRGEIYQATALAVLFRPQRRRGRPLVKEQWLSESMFLQPLESPPGRPVALKDLGQLPAPAVIYLEPKVARRRFGGI